MHRLTRSTNVRSVPIQWGGMRIALRTSESNGLGMGCKETKDVQIARQERGNWQLRRWVDSVFPCANSNGFPREFFRNQSVHLKWIPDSLVVSS